MPKYSLDNPNPNGGYLNPSQEIEGAWEGNVTITPELINMGKATLNMLDVKISDEKVNKNGRPYKRITFNEHEVNQEYDKIVDETKCSVSESKYGGLFGKVAFKPGVLDLILNDGGKVFVSQKPVVNSSNGDYAYLDFAPTKEYSVARPQSALDAAVEKQAPQAQTQKPVDMIQDDDIPF